MTLTLIYGRVNQSGKLSRLFELIYDSYLGGRHEMLHEVNRRDVIINLLVWTSGVLQNGG
jgi:hypothetical protein